MKIGRWTLMFVLCLGLSGKAMSSFMKDNVEVLIPFEKTSGVFLYDFIGQESLLGIETSILRFTKAKNLTLTAGILTDASCANEGELRERERDVYFSGTPFFGLHIPINLEGDPVELGGFISRNLSEGKNIAGLKCSFKFW